MIVMLMGPAASGKTTIGEALSAKMGWQFVDGDLLHPEENIRKMAAGIPLTDVDRQGWLKAVHDLMSDWQAAGQSGVIACSALKRAYREELEVGKLCKVAYLKVSRPVLLSRLEHRHGHYMHANMLDSQLDILEEPEENKGIVTVVDGELPVGEIVSQIIARLELG